jgi:N-acetylmuramoyl-L-alanine amidase
MLSNSGWISRYQGAAIAWLLLLALGLIAAQTSPGLGGSQGQSASPQVPPAPPADQSSPHQSSSGQTAPPLQSFPPVPKALVMIDPAHGGSESGAMLNPVILEKDVTLALARRLRLGLGGYGVLAELVRDSDINLSVDERAGKANAAHPVLYVCLHATSEAAGIRVYTAMFGEVAESRGPFVNWNTAQFPFLTASHSAQQQMVTAIQKSGISARPLAAPLRPLNNVTSAAVAVEVAPTKADVSQLMSIEYEQAVSAALANGIAQVLSDLGTNPGVAR